MVSWQACVVVDMHKLAFIGLHEMLLETITFALKNFYIFKSVKKPAAISEISQHLFQKRENQLGLRSSYTQVCTRILFGPSGRLPGLFLSF
jgi:hypothetical protein